jgi:DNA-binding NtrC family response regulator
VPIILILEDIPTVRAVFRSALERRGDTILEAATADEARTTCNEYCGRLDLLIADVVLPASQSGPQFAVDMIAADPHLKVLFSSGTEMAYWSAPDFQAMAKLPVGSYSFLAKPFRAEELERKVEELLGQS